MNSLVKYTGVCFLGLSLSACVTSPVESASDSVDSDTIEASTYIDQGRNFNVRPTASREFDDVFVVGEAFEASPYSELPSFLRQDIFYRQIDPVSMADIVNDLSKELGTRIIITAEINVDAEEESASGTSSAEALKERSIENLTTLIPDQVKASSKNLVGGAFKLRINHHGPVAALLDRITSSVGLYWEWRNDHVAIFKTKTKTFPIDALPSSISMNSSFGTNRQNSDDAGGQSGSTQSVTDAYETGDSHVDIEETLKSMLSPHGKITRSRAMGIATVTDIPPVLEMVDQYVKKINKLVNRNVSLRTQIYEITVSDTSDVGIDWAALFQGSSRYGVKLASAFTGGVTPNLTGTILSPGSSFKDAVMSLRSENKLQDISTVTDHTTVTKHNQASPLQLGNIKGYLESMTITPATDSTGAGGTGGSPGSVTLEPGEILDGITMNILPRVLSDNSIDVRVGIDVSDLNAINEIRVGEGESESLIQVTDVTGKSISNTVNIKSGETMLLAGFERTTDEAATTSLFGKAAWMLGGSKKGGTTRVMTVILVTPHLLK